VRAAGAAARTEITFDSAAFMRSLATKVAALEIATEAGLWVFAMRVQNNARVLAPVDTGRLRSSIMATKGRDSTGPYVEIGTNVEYAAFVEFGTRFQVAQPYLRPALAVAIPQFMEGMAAG
jgi:HK97 gp10 family phage protein